MELKTILRIAACAVLLIGLSTSVWIYRTAGDGGNTQMVDDFENSKIYNHNLELYGGKMNVIGDRFQHWFMELWKGKRLATTTTAITLSLSLGLFLMAAYVSIEDEPAGESDTRKGDDHPSS